MCEYLIIGSVGTVFVYIFIIVLHHNSALYGHNQVIIFTPTLHFVAFSPTFAYVYSLGDDTEYFNVNAKEWKCKTLKSYILYY
jgi:hypothetical protein